MHPELGLMILLNPMCEDLTMPEKRKRRPRREQRNRGTRVHVLWVVFALAVGSCAGFMYGMDRNRRSVRRLESELSETNEYLFAASVLVEQRTHERNALQWDVSLEEAKKADVGPNFQIAMTRELLLSERVLPLPEE